MHRFHYSCKGSSFQKPTLPEQSKHGEIEYVGMLIAFQFIRNLLSKSVLGPFMNIKQPRLVVQSISFTSNSQRLKEAAQQFTDLVVKSVIVSTAPVALRADILSRSYDKVAGCLLLPIEDVQLRSNGLTFYLIWAGSADRLEGERQCGPHFHDALV